MTKTVTRFRKPMKPRLREERSASPTTPGKVSLTNTTTDGTDPLCFPNIPEGDYNISVAVPEGYNPTTSMNYPLSLKAGDKTILDFGAQISSKASSNKNQDSSRSPILAIFGGICVLGGIGMGIYLWKFKR